MTDTKFTKGEWTIDNTGYYTRILIDSCVMCRIQPTNIHNAHLIASAPAMYEMIKELAHELNLAIDECNEYRAIGINSSTESDPDYIDKQTINESQVLLSKARGE